MADYVLGTHAEELERLRFQHAVWREVTDRFLDRIGVKKGARCLDVGCGPGFVTLALAERVGPEGSVAAVDLAEHWLAHLATAAKDLRLDNVSTLCGPVEELDLGEGRFDLIFSRWVFSFLPDPARVLAMLARALAPGGTVAIQDYNHEGISLFPESKGFKAAVEATRRLYAKSGGDMWVAGLLPALFREAGLETCHYRANVLTGGPRSDAFRWADAFFPTFADRFVEAGVMSQKERERFLREWRARSADPDSVFFSPIVVDAAARKVAGEGP